MTTLACSQAGCDAANNALHCVKKTKENKCPLDLLKKEKEKKKEK